MVAVFRGFSRVKEKERAVALGNFDGVHLGHQQLLRVMVASARMRGLIPCVVSFYPHPAVVLRKSPSVARLSDLCDLTSEFAKQGIEELHLLRFSAELSRWPGEEFLARLSASPLSVRHLVVGADARIGSGAAMDAEAICGAAPRFGIEAQIVPLVTGVAGNGGKIGSRAIRGVVEAGDVATAAQALGRPYRLRGRVVRGDGRGRSIGVRTANLHTAHRLVPGRGVYATVTSVAGVRYPSVTNIGVRPTFGLMRLTVESHLLNYGGEEFYEAMAEVEFVEKLRDEKRFASVNDLVQQIEIDKQNAASLVAARGVL